MPDLFTDFLFSFDNRKWSNCARKNWKSISSCAASITVPIWVRCSRCRWADAGRTAVSTATWTGGGRGAARAVSEAAGAAGAADRDRATDTVRVRNRRTIITLTAGRAVALRTGGYREAVRGGRRAAIVSDSPTCPDRDKCGSGDI